MGVCPAVASIEVHLGLKLLRALLREQVMENGQVNVSVTCTPEGASYPPSLPVPLET